MSDAADNNNSSQFVDKQLCETANCIFVSANWTDLISVVYSDIARVKFLLFEFEFIPLYSEQKYLKKEFLYFSSIRLVNSVTIVRIIYIWQEFIGI